MDSINSFDIRLEKDVYYPGEPLNGVVIIDLMEPIKLRGIRVFLRGRARVQWKVLKSGESKTLKDDQYLLDDKALLWGRERQQQQQTFDELDETTSIESDLIQQQQTQILPKGLHELAFNFNLPPTQLPCSLETKSPLTGQDHKIRCQPCCRRGNLEYRIDKGGGLPIEIKTIQSTALEWRSQFVLKHSQLNIDPNNFDPLLQLPTLPPTMKNVFRVDFCGGHVETGKYISPEFRLGQVWDGRIQENENNNNLNIEEIVLYRPVYVKIIGEQQQTEKALASNNSGGGICRRQSTRIVGCSNNENNILTKQKEGVTNILN
uniref:Arrestin-like N-terminal domain-containing protein n=1 Tax=Meloidogyne javanica TaxID=6303 RepID=A0A915MJ10_MELJA